ncbi:MAG TPA: adenylate/guanylate cyclase domain-containing protein [Nocardioidaceae bacterium]|jgi:class 3 adenylate cyclase/tetratricopeptide (TPR) repeat protein|nr:adenylate/guanylate cyclase domain-containing protein [Nocardioidaceae bacterium]
MSVCSGCGEQQPEGARFCFSCGASLAAPVCATCGEQLVPGARFCSSCGAAQGGAPLADGQPVPEGAAPAIRGQSAGPVLGQPVAARRVTSVLFGDLVGFTSLSESRDQEEVRELLSSYFDQCRQVIGRYGGTVEKFIGDAVMAVWGVPTAHEDDAERSVRAGLELVNAVTAMGEDLGVPELAMRVGIVTGEVAVTIGAQQQGMVAGDAVNTASRVQSVASPGQVWVDETTRLLTSSAITYVDVGSHALKGKAEPVPLWAAQAVVAARGGAQRADGLEAPLVGRDRELRLIKELFHAAQESPRPSLVVIDGDPGVGKSRLAWEFEKYVDGLTVDTMWHSGRCVAYGEGVAYYALAEAIRGRLASVTLDGDVEELELDQQLDAALDHYVPDDEERVWLRARVAALLGSAAVGSFDREDLFAAWTTFLERVGGGDKLVAIVIDDAQHADEGLLAFVDHLLTVGSFSCFVMMLSRPGLLEGHPSLATNRHATVVHLPTLSAPDIAQLLDGLVSGLPERVRNDLVDRAEGVPLFAVETVRSLIDRDLVVPRGGQYVLAAENGFDLDSIGAPATLQALISARLDSLSPTQRQVVDRASVLGGSFRRQDVAALVPGLAESGEVDAVLGQLVRLQILSRETSRLSSEFGQYQFVQSVVRQVAYSTLSRRDRKATELRVVELLLPEVEESEDVVPMIAQHYLDALEAVAGDDDVPELKRAAIEFLERAAARASRLGSPKEAAGHLMAALEHADDPADQARLQCDLAWALNNAADYERAAEHAAAAVRTFDRLGDAVRAGVAAAAQSRAVDNLGNLEAGLEIAESRWEALQGRADADEALLALGKEVAACRVGLSMDVRDTVERWMRVADRAGSTPVIADSMITLANYYSNIGLPFVCRAILQAGADLARVEHRPVVLARALINLNALSTHEDVSQAADYGREALAVATTSGSQNYISFARVNLALALFEQGAWAELEQLLAADDDSLIVMRGTYDALSCLLRQGQGRPWSLSWEAGSPPPIDDRNSVAWQLLCEAQWARGEGRRAAAVAAGLEAVETMLEATGRWDDFPFAWALAADLVLEAGDDPAYLQLMEMAGDGRERLPLSMNGHLARTSALWAMRQAPTSPDVEAGLRRAIDIYQRWGSVIRVARTRADLAFCLAGQGRDIEAGPLLEQARTTFEQIGAAAWLAATEERLVAPRVEDLLP